MVFAFVTKVGTEHIVNIQLALVDAETENVFFQEFASAEKDLKENIVKRAFAIRSAWMEHVKMMEHASMKIDYFLITFFISHKISHSPSNPNRF